MRIVIFSNNPLSHNGSNGRTMLSMLEKFKSNEILNIFFNGSNCALERASFYKINEKKLINPFSHHYGCFILQNIDTNRYFNTAKKRTPLKLLMRNFVWHNKRNFKETLQVIRNFKPDVALVQCGDNSFLINFALKITKEINIKLCGFNTEEYIFKDTNYILGSYKKGFFFKIFQKKLVSAYDLFYSTKPTVIYLTDSLKTLYLSRYPSHYAYTIFNSSNIMAKGASKKKGVLYFGNLGLGRIDSLIMISNYSMKYLNKKIDIYSNCNDKAILNKITHSPNINYRGFLPYNLLLKNILNAELIIHVESTNSFYEVDSRNAFSTKIADCLSSGIPFFVYAPSKCYTSSYLKNNDCGFVANNEKEVSILFEKFRDSDFLNSKNEQNLKIARKNHSAKNNSEVFINVLRKAIGEYHYEN